MKIIVLLLLLIVGIAAEEDDFVMIIGGTSDCSDPESCYLDDVELISLDPITNPVPDCLTQLNKIPTPLSDLAGALDYTEGGVPFICGGVYYDGDYYDSDLCFKYVPSSDEWVVSGVMSEAKSEIGYGSSESWGLVMAGGDNGGPLLSSSVETTADGIIFENLPDLEVEVSGSCVVVIDDDRIFTSGGYHDPGLRRDSYIFSRTNNSWSRMANMPFHFGGSYGRRCDHSCGLVMHPENGPEIVVAGGYNGRSLYSVDIYTVDTDSWRKANFLPTAIEGAAAVAFNNSMLLVGGRTSINGTDEVSGDIYQYNAADDEWFKMESELKTPRAYHVALPVKQSIFPDCS